MKKGAVTKRSVLFWGRKRDKKANQRKSWYRASAIFALIQLPFAPINLPTLVNMMGYSTPFDSKVAEIMTGREYGEDKRTKASEFEQLISPIVRIKIVNERGIFTKYCTGAAIGPTVFVTAAHCLSGDVDTIYLDRGGKYTNDRSLSTGTDFAKTTDYVIHDQYDGHNNDIGLVFTKNPVNNWWFKVEKFPENKLTSFHLETGGYPGDKEEGTMWKAEYTGFGEGWFDKKLSSAGVAYQGQSGSPMYKSNPTKQDGEYGKIYAVLSGGAKNPKNGKSFTTIEPFDKEDIDWINMKGR